MKRGALMATEFRQVLREAAEQRDANLLQRPRAAGAADRMRFQDLPRASASRRSASETAAAYEQLTEYHVGAQVGVEKVETLSINDLKKRIRAGLTRQQISALRREFARINHPDRTHATDRELANDLMAQANDLLDEASNTSG